MTNQPLARSSPAMENVDSRLLINALNAIELAGIELHSMMVAVNGKVIFEGHNAPYDPDIPHIIHSMTKTFTNTAVAMAYGQGLLRPEDKMVDFFSDRIPVDACDYLKEITIENLITMRAGHGREISGGEWRLLKTSWVDAFFREPVVKKPGEVYQYSSANSYILSAIVQQVTGKTAHEYLKDCFLDKLGFKDLTWDLSPEGINSGGNGISLTVEDIVRLGLVYLQKGVWKGEQIIAVDWVDRAFGRINPLTPPEGVKPYNYHWFKYGDYTYSSSGVFGQHCIVVPKLNFVIGVTSASMEHSKIVEMIVENLINPMITGSSPEPKCDDILLKKGQRLSLLWRPRSVSSSVKLKPGTNVYPVEKNIDNVTSISIRVQNDMIVFGMTDDRGSHIVHCGLDRWVWGYTSITGAYLHHSYESDCAMLVGLAWWKSENELCMEWRYPEMTFCDYVTLVFSEDGSEVSFERSVNVNMKAMSRPVLSGQRQ